MNAAKQHAAGVVNYELEVRIDASPDDVWHSLTKEINEWWLPDFHMTGEGSTVTLDLRAGGQLLETHPGGDSLLWSTVIMCEPSKHTLHFSGVAAPAWGGPSTSILRFSVRADGDGAVLEVADAIHGNIDESNVKSLKEGWTWLMTDGLKKHVEGKAS